MNDRNSVTLSTDQPLCDNYPRHVKNTCFIQKSLEYESISSFS